MLSPSALMSKPHLLLLDEPTLSLAPLVIAQIFDIIRTIRDEGVTVFLVGLCPHAGPGLGLVFPVRS